MPTLFTCPKPFEGDTGVHQRNAVRSWMELDGDVEILLLGDDAGVAAFAEEHGLRHILDVETNEHGTPLVSSIFLRAQEEASHEVMCYVNADIVLLDGFLDSVVAAIEARPRSLISGRRWDLDIQEEIDYRDRWEDRIRERIRTEGSLSKADTTDYFVYKKGLFDEIPPFAIGRFAWANWLMFDARKKGYTIVDASPVVDVVHHLHDYTVTDHEGREEEVEGNFELIGGKPWGKEGAGFQEVLTLADADYKLTKQGLKPNRSPMKAWRWMLDKSREWAFLRPVIYVVRKARRLYRTGF